LLPTVTVTVTPLATVGRKAKSEAIINTNIAKQREEVFIGLAIANNLLGHAIPEK
jgi:hypothetical protein